MRQGLEPVPDHLAQAVQDIGGHVRAEAGAVAADRDGDGLVTQLHHPVLAIFGAGPAQLPVDELGALAAGKWSALAEAERRLVFSA